MIIKKLRLQDFRNHKLHEFELSNKTTLIVGKNASGKTNILEGIYLLATGKSFRANLEQEMINWDTPLSRIKGRIVDEKETTDLEIVLTRGEVAGEKTARKKYLVNGVSRRMSDFVGTLKAVYFGPEDLDLVTGSPSLRRRYLDAVLSQADREYSRSALSYEKGLRQRNKLLEKIRDENGSRSQLLFWDQLLIKNGEVITQKREEFINFVNNIKYQISDIRYQIYYDKSIISPSRLAEYAQEEVAAAATLVGPHRDDFRLVIRNNQDGKSAESPRDMAVYGSRGEQRLAVLWLKLCELESLSQKSGKRPVLLLDDIFSELDHEHRKMVLELIPKQQTILSSADIHLVEKQYQKRMEVVEL
ncbi:MAG: DNA replication and repair protein RecF [bacterium]|nr:DNA replication and repair protein RecF [bacterium]